MDHFILMIELFAFRFENKQFISAPILKIRFRKTFQTTIYSLFQRCTVSTASVMDESISLRFLNAFWSQQVIYATQKRKSHNILTKKGYMPHIYDELLLLFEN